MPFLPPNQLQRQSTEGIKTVNSTNNNNVVRYLITTIIYVKKLSKNVRLLFSAV